jgi:hypothetical protein
MMMTAKTPSVSTIGNSNNNNNNNSNNISNNNQSSSSSIRKKEQIKRRPRRGRLLLYSVILFAICWLQIAANVFTYFSSHYEQQQDQTQPSAVARFSSYYSSDGNNNNTTDGNIEQHHQQQPPPSPSLEVQLSQLQTRLRLLQQQQHQQEDINYDINTNTNTNSTTTTTTTTAPKVMFIPFTIRDAQRTVPTQIPHGFHIFDFIDLYASDSDGEQNQTQTEINDTLTNTTTAITTKSKLYHNGKPVIVDPGVVRKEEEEEECRGYTKKCYRTKMLRVIKYLQSLQQQNTNTNTNTNNYEYYYFYMEADNDLCVPLNEIKQIALKYRRYFTNTGEGIGSASGWIMSQQFLNDFYSYWYNIFNSNNNNNNNNTLSSSLLTEEQKLEPNTVASVLLKQKQNWSVTRRYLTSHSILVGNTNDAGSISNLYEHVEEEEGNITTATNSSNSSSSSKVAIVVATTTAPGNNNAAAADGADEQHPDSSMGLLEKLTSKKLLSASVLDDKKSLSSVMEPARYLPRCLEPHRGIWPDKNKTKEEDNNYDNKSNNNNNNNVAIDMYHWDFFDYDLCPESDIFPCKEGQLGIK